MDELVEAFKEAKGNKSLNRSEADDLIAAKDARKAQIGVSATVPPNFDNMQ
jgi:hypothetical protein